MPSGEPMIERVVRILEAFRRAGHPLTASEIARQAAIPVPSTHRIVTDLVNAGLLDRDADRRFRIGIRLWEIVSRSSGIFSLRDIALPYLEDLGSVVNAPRTLSVLDTDDVLNVCALSAVQPKVTFRPRPGIRMPPLATSTGVVLVAFAPLAVRQRILSAGNLTRFTEHTVMDRDELTRIVECVRRTRHVIARGWMAPDTSSVAVPVLAVDGTAIAALAVTLPFDSDSHATVLPALHSTARGISRAFVAGSERADPGLSLFMHRIRSSSEIT